MKVLTAVHGLILPLVFCVALVCAQTGGFTLQVASVPTEADAQAMTKQLQAKGLESYWNKVELAGKGTRYRIYVGHFATREEAQRQGAQGRSQGLIKEFIILADQTALKAAANTSREAKTPMPNPRSVEAKVRSKDKASATSTASPPAPAKTTAVTRPEEATPNVTAREAAVNPLAYASGGAGKTGEPPSVATEKTAMTSATRERRAADAQSVASKSQLASPSKTEVLMEAKAEVKEEAKEQVRSAKTQTPVSLEAETPSVADALTNVAIANPKWEIVRQSSATNKNLRAIFFVDSLTGWAAGEAGTVFRTTDGGRTWKPLVTNASININRLHFVDWNTGWMIGEIPGKEKDAPQTVLLSTINGGRTWIRQALPDLVGFYFVDAKTGWAVGYNATLLKTTDGGVTWQNYADLEKLIGLPVESGTYNFGFCDVQFMDANQGWAIGNFYGRAKNHLGGLFVTSDGGATWKRLPLTVQTQHSSNRLTPGLLHTVHFSDASNGQVTGEMNDGEARYFFVLTTKDGGKTWQQQRSLTSSAHRTQFVSAAQGWTSAVVPRRDEEGETVYDTSFMRTENGGASWLTDFTARGNQIRGLFFLSPAKGWAVGDRGIILRYDSRQ